MTQRLWHAQYLTKTFATLFRLLTHSGSWKMLLQRKGTSRTESLSVRLMHHLGLPRWCIAVAVTGLSFSIASLGSYTGYYRLECYITASFPSVSFLWSLFLTLYFVALAFCKKHSNRCAGCELDMSFLALIRAQWTLPSPSFPPPQEKRQLCPSSPPPQEKRQLCMCQTRTEVLVIYPPIPLMVTRVDRPTVLISL